MTREEEAKEFTMHCQVCSHPLTALEQELHGSFCVFHTSQFPNKLKEIPIWKAAIRGIADAMFYNIKLRMRNSGRDDITIKAWHQASLGDNGFGSCTSMRTSLDKFRVIWYLLGFFSKARNP